jgi:hypothetical protein
MDNVLKRIAIKCEEAKKRLIIIPPVKKRRTILPEPYLKEMIQGKSRKVY